MNTANLQLQGLLLAVSSLLETMRRKGLLSEQEIDLALRNAEANTRPDVWKDPPLSGANLDAIRFPIRYLRTATNLSPDAHISFTDVAAIVGETKPDH